MITAKELIDDLNLEESKRRKGKFGISDIVLFLICALILLINFYFVGSQNKIIILSVSVFILAIVFLFLIFAHKFYEKAFNIANPGFILIFVYVLSIINIVLTEKGFYSVEWAFLGFIIAMVICYDFRIDSRFLILPALLLLAYIPFLLIGNFNSFAESIAIYVYYFLVVGVILQLAEHIIGYEENISFEKVFSAVIKKDKIIEVFILIIGLVCAMIIVAGRFADVDFWKWTSVYLFFLALSVYLISYLSKQESLAE